MTGIIHNLADAEYRKDPGVAQSDLKLVMRSPAHLVAAKSSPREETPSLMFGRLVHHLALTPDAPVWWVERPAGLDLRTKEGKAWTATIGDKTVVTAEHVGAASRIVENLMQHDAWRLCSATAKTEVSAFREVEVAMGDLPTMPIRTKARIDLVPALGPALVDLKTTDDARPDQFARSIDEFGYHIQAAWYLDTWNALTGDDRTEFVIFAVEKSTPHNVAAYAVHADAIQHGRMLYHEALETYAQCVRSGCWPGYTTDIRALNIPRYAYTRHQVAKIWSE